MKKDNPSSVFRILLTILTAVLQAALLYAALLTFDGFLSIPTEWSIVFAIFGIACLAGAIAAGSGIKFDRVSAVKKSIELSLPSLSIQPAKEPDSQQQTAFGHTEYIFDNAAPDVTELLATEMIRNRKLRLIWSEGGSDKTAEATNFPLYIGRDAALCAVVINDSGISRRHARISLNAGVYSVSDAGSSNGTLLDDEVVTSDMEIRTGQVIKLGRVSIRVEIQG